MTVLRTTWGVVSLQMICAQSRVLLAVIVVVWVLDVLSRR